MMNAQRSSYLIASGSLQVSFSQLPDFIASSLQSLKPLNKNIFNHRDSGRASSSEHSQDVV